MIAELLYNKWFWVGIAIVIGLLIHRLLFSKNRTLEILEREYSEILNSDKYKVKGQFD